jgi:excisionase family DNA binding protein
MDTENGLPKLAYSIDEACKVSSLGRSNLYAMIKQGRLAKIQIGRRTLIPAQSLHALVLGEVA